MKVSGDIGVISDTHALLRPEAMRALDGCELILHAGDIGNSQLISALKERASVVAIRGNIDKGPWAVNTQFRRQSKSIANSST